MAMQYFVFLMVMCWPIELHGFIIMDQFLKSMLFIMLMEIN